MLRVSIIRCESNIGLTFGSIFSISASARFVSGVHIFRSASVFLDSCFLSLQKFNPWVFSFLAGLGHIDGAGSSVFAVSIGGDMKQTTCLIGEHLKSQNFCPRARKIRAVVDTHQDIIEHNAPVMSQIFLDHNKHGAFEGHRKEDVTSKVSNPPFTNLIQRSDSNEKPMLIR